MERENPDSEDEGTKINLSEGEYKYNSEVTDGESVGRQIPTFAAWQMDMRPSPHIRPHVDQRLARGSSVARIITMCIS